MIATVRGLILHCFLPVDNHTCIITMQAQAYQTHTDAIGVGFEFYATRLFKTEITNTQGST